MGESIVLSKRIKLIMTSIVMIFALVYSNKVFAQSNITVNRIAGQNRYETSNAIISKGWSQSNVAILVNSENFPDAIVSSPLAKKYNAPILLTESNSLTDSTKQELQTLGVKNVIIIGGLGVISDNVDNAIKTLGINTRRIYGQDRYETSVNVAKELGNVTNAFVLSGEDWEDALTIAPIASKMQAPILLIASDGTIPSSVSNYGNDNCEAYFNVVGTENFGNEVLHENFVVSTSFTMIHFLEGDNPVDIVNQIIKDSTYNNSIDLSNLYLASNSNFADALSGSALAGINGNPIILVGDSNQSSINSFISDNKVSSINVLGGTGVLSDYVVNQIIGNEPSEIVLKDTDKPLISTGAGDATNNELWLKYSDGTEELLVSSHSAEDIKDVIAFIQNPQFSLDKKKIYFMSAAWATSYSIHVVDIETKNEHFVCDGNSLKVIQSGLYAGDLIVNKYKYYGAPNYGSYDDYYIVTPEGQEIKDIGDDPEILSQYQ